MQLPNNPQNLRRLFYNAEKNHPIVRKKCGDYFDLRRINPLFSAQFAEIKNLSISTKARMEYYNLFQALNIY